MDDVFIFGIVFSSFVDIFQEDFMEVGLFLLKTMEVGKRVKSRIHILFSVLLAQTSKGERFV
jgi:hypothetical protein